MVEAGTEFPLMLPLAFLFVFETGEGEFDSKVRITDPKGNVGEPLSTGRVAKPVGQPAQIMVNFGAMLIHATGTFKIELILDDHNYASHFTVNFAQRPIT